MAETIDFNGMNEQLNAEHQAEIDANQKKAEAAIGNAVEVTEDMDKDTDHTDDVNPVTGKPEINGKPMEKDPATPGETPTPQEGNGGDRNGPATDSPKGPKADQEGPVPQRPLISKDEFMGKKKGFFNPDVPKNFWNTLEGGIDKMLSGNTAEDIAQNMFFGAIDLFFDMLANAMDARRKEKARQKEEYLKTKEAYEKELGITGRHKKSIALVLAALNQGVKLNPEGDEDIKVTEEQKKGMLKYLKSAKAIEDYKEAYQAITGTECTDAEAKAAVRSVSGKSISKESIKDHLAKRGLSPTDKMYETWGKNSPTEAAQAVHGMYQTCKAHEDDVKAEREAMHNYKVKQKEAELQQCEQREPTPHQPDGRGRT